MHKKLAVALLLGLSITASTCFALEIAPAMSVDPGSAETPSQNDAYAIPKNLGSVMIYQTIPNAVKPAWILAEMKPGDTMEDSVTVENKSTDEKTLILSARDGDYTAEGDFTVKSAEETPVEIGSWITLEETDLVLPAGEKKEIKYTLAIPATVAFGEYKGGITISETGTRNASGVRITTTVAQKVQVNVTDDPKPVPKMQPRDFFTSIFITAQKSGTPYLWGSLGIFALGIAYFIYGTIREKRKKHARLK